MNKPSSNLAVIESDSVIVSMHRASTALAEAKTIQHTKKILDVAAAAEIYARRQHLSEEAIDLAGSIKVEALRKLGEMLVDMNKATGTAGHGRPKIGGTKSVPPKSEPPSASPPTLAELGLDKKTSALAQKLATLPEKAYEQVREGHVTVSKAIAMTDARKAVSSEKKAAAEAAKQAAADQAAAAAAAREAAAPSTEEQIQSIADEKEQEERIALLMEDEPLKAMTEKCKQLQFQVRILTSQVNGLLSEKTQAVASANSWRRKHDRLEKGKLNGGGDSHPPH